MRASSTLVTVLAMGALAATGCGKVPGMGGKSKVDPNSCGNYAVSDAGRKLHGFLEATVALEVAANKVESVVKESCVCTVNADIAARAAAQCEAKAEADIGVTCSGTCNGTCDGQCSGSGTAGTGGSSGSGNCNGQCSGTCHGGCDGTADVNASAQCKAEAEVKASVDVECSEPELTVNADASAVLDTSKAELTLAAIRNGMPKMPSIQARLRPLQAAATTWAKSARELGAASGELAQSFKDQALCISGQISGAVAAIAHIEASINVSVSVSASASGSVGTN